MKWRPVCSALCTLHSALCTLHSALPSALPTLHQLRRLFFPIIWRRKHQPLAIPILFHILTSLCYLARFYLSPLMKSRQGIRPAWGLNRHGLACSALSGLPPPPVSPLPPHPQGGQRSGGPWCGRSSSASSCAGSSCPSPPTGPRGV